MKKHNYLLLLMFLISACEKCSFEKSKKSLNNNRFNQTNDTGNNNNIANNTGNNNTAKEPLNNASGNNNNIANNIDNNNTANEPLNNASGNNIATSKPDSNNQPVVNKEQEIIDNMINSTDINSIKNFLEEFKKLHTSDTKAAFAVLMHNNGDKIIENIILPKENNSKEILELLNFIINEGFLGDTYLFSNSFNHKIDIKTTKTDFFYTTFFTTLFDSKVIGEHDISKKFNDLFNFFDEKNIYLTSGKKEALRYLLVDKHLIDNHISALVYNNEMPIFIENLVKFAIADNFNSVISETKSMHAYDERYKANAIYDLLLKDEDNQIAYTLMRKNIKFMDYPVHTNKEDFKTFDNTFKNSNSTIKNLLLTNNATREQYLKHHYKEDVHKNLNLPTDINNCIDFILDDNNKESTDIKFARVKNIVRYYAKIKNNKLDSSFFNNVIEKLKQNKKGYLKDANTVIEFLGFSQNGTGIASEYNLEENSKTY